MVNTKNRPKISGQNTPEMDLESFVATPTDTRNPPPGTFSRDDRPKSLTSLFGTPI